MDDALALGVCGVFAAPAAWYFRMVMLPMRGEGGAVPSVDGKPLFVPTRRSMIAIGFVLLLFACLVAAPSGLLSLGLPANVLAWLSYGLAAGLLARAVGEFRYVGFFKRVRGSRFAWPDTLVYSPICLLLAAGVAMLAWRSGS